MTKEIYMATQNPGKVAEFNHLLTSSDWKILKVPSKLDFPETKETFEGNATEKALNYAKELQGLVFSEDSGLVVPSLNGFPGIYSARIHTMNSAFGVPVITQAGFRLTHSQGSKDKLNCKIVLNAMEYADKLKLVSQSSYRSAYYVSHICVALPGQVLINIERKMEGEIAPLAKGSNGFGYDAIFIPRYLHGINVGFQGQTIAELPSYAKEKISHRYKSTQALIKFLNHLKV